MIVSVIIPVHNRLAYLHCCLDSVRKAFGQLSSAAEAIVVDDGSDQEDVCGFLRGQFPDARYFHQQNMGAPAARNHGLRQAKGKYIVLLDSDDLIEEGFFKEKLMVLEGDKNLSGVYGPWEYFRGEGAFEEEQIVPRYSPYPLDKAPNSQQQLIRLLGGWYIPSHAILWRKAALDKIGGQNEKLRINQDVDLMFRALAEGGRLKGIDGGRALIRDHDQERVGSVNSSPAKLAQMLELRMFFHKKLQDKGLWDSQMAEALSRFCFDYWVTYRREFPELSAQFLAFSNELAPNLNVRGSKAFEWLGKVVGKENATEIKEFINQFR